MKPSLVVLAAGMGSRYGGLKQIDPVGPADEVILDYSVYDALRAGFGKVVFVIRRDIEDEFRARVGARYEGRLPVEYVFQDLRDLPTGFTPPEGRVKPWGTVHATLSARAAVREPFGVINADDFYGPGAFRALADALCGLDPAAADYVLVAYRLGNTLSPHGHVSRGICDLSPQGFLRSVEECHHIHAVPEGVQITRAAGVEVVDGNRAVSMNTWGFTPGFFQQAQEGFVRFLGALSDPLKSEFYIPTLMQALIDRGEARVRVISTAESWLGVTYPEDKPVVQAGLREKVAQRVYPSPLWD